MGHRKRSAPRHGSLGVRPRKRASKIVPRVRSWPEHTWPEILINRFGAEASKYNIVAKPMLQGYVVYKAGMTHALVLDDRPHSPTSGREIFMPLTVLDAPPLVILGVRGYVYDPMTGLKTVGEAWNLSIDSLTKLIEEKYGENPFINMDAKEIIRKYLKGLRKINPGLVKSDPGSEYGYKFMISGWEKKIAELESMELRDVRVIASTIPVLTGFGKKKPDIVEIRIGGGSIEDRLKYAKEIIGGYITVDQVFREGQYVDVIGVTKGKGFQGVIKRFGVKELPRWHKHRKGSRKIGARSPGFGTMSETPQAGQTGFHRRTEYNKRIIKIGWKGWEITPKGGFLGYGLVFGPYILVKGSVIGVRKRPLVLRHPIRPPSLLFLEAPTLTYYSHESKQGD